MAFTILELSLVICLVVCYASASSWYMGCYKFDPSLKRWNVVGYNNQTTLVAASRKCGINQYTYMLMSADNYTCVGSMKGLKLVLSPTPCDIKCVGSLSDVAVSCGSASRSHVSMYYSDGPFLRDVAIAVVADYVVVDRAVTLQATARLMTHRNITQHGSVFDRGLQLVFEWLIDKQTLTSSTVEADSHAVHSSISHTFTSTEQHFLEVRVHNIVTNESSALRVTPIVPAPLELQASLKSDRQPSCIPHKPRSNRHAKTVAVYVNETSTLLASVAVGTNLTFVVSYGDTGEDVTHRSSDAICSVNDSCTQFTQDHVFERLGEFPVRVSVTNQYGRMEQDITVVVVDHQLSNLTFSRENAHSSYVASNTKVHFIITMETASRAETILDVSFGDDERRMYAVRGDNMTHADSRSPDHIAITRSYGIGCTLKLELTHVFVTPGHVDPRAEASNHVGNTTATCRGFSIVNALRAPRLVLADVVAVDTLTYMRLRFAQRSRSVEITWTINSPHLDSTIRNDNAALNFTFPAPGNYVVRVNARNPISSVSVSAIISVQITISNLTLKCRGSRYIRLDVPLVCTATVDTGYNVSFLWSFGHRTKMADDTGRLLTSTEEYRFSHPGTYNVSVIASNRLTSLTRRLPYSVTAQRPIDRVIIDAAAPKPVDTNTLLAAAITAGSHAVVEFAVASAGLQLARRNDTDNWFYVNHTFPTPGVYNVSVYAHNAVSSARAHASIIAERSIRDFRVAVVGNVCVNDTTKFLLISNGPCSVSVVLSSQYYSSVVYLTDSSQPLGTVLYREVWYGPANLSNDSVAITESDVKKATHTGVTEGDTSPLIVHTFGIPGRCNVTFTLSNHLTSVARTIPVVVDGTKPNISLQHPFHVRLNEPVNFTIRALDPPKAATVKYDDGFPEIKLASPSFGWVRTFPKVGVHRFVASVRLAGGGNGGTVLESVVSVEEPVSSVYLTGPRLIPLYRRANNAVWWLHTSDGSHLCYTWTLDGGATVTSLYPMFSRLIETPGSHNITAVAKNSVSSAQATLIFTAQYPLVKCDLTIRPVLHGDASIVAVTIRGGGDYRVDVDYGDGTLGEFTSADTDVVSPLESAPPGDSHRSPVATLSIRHVYRKSGDYAVRVNVTDSLSRVTGVATARVEEAITGVVVTTNSPSVLATNGNTTVTVRATVATGNDLTFKWQFGELLDMYDSRRVSDKVHEATYKYSMVGTYWVTVLVKNDLYTTPVNATAPKPFLVVDKISELSLDVPRPAAFKKDSSGQWQSESVTMSARCESCSHTTFTFFFGDGTNATAKAVALESEMWMLSNGMGASVSHIYKSEGMFQVSVVATNPLGSVRHMALQIYYVQIPPTSVSLDKAMYATLLGNATVFNLTIDQGTNLTVEWNMNDETTLIKPSPAALRSMVSHMYLIPGDFRVSVDVSNEVATGVSANAWVIVRNKIQGVRLYQVKPAPVGNDTTVVATGSTVTYKAEAFPGGVMFTRIYDFYRWNIGGELKEREYGDTVEHTFYRHGAFTVTASAYNPISQAVSTPLSIRVIGPITTLTIEYNGPPVVNQSMQFSLMTPRDISDFVLTWDFNDSTPLVSTNSTRINHTFLSTGIFVVKLHAQNPLSAANTSRLLFILNNICYPPEIQLYPLYPKSTSVIQITQSDVLRIDSRIFVNCSLSSILDYEWSITNATSPTSLPLPSRYALNNRILYLPAANLPYGDYNARLKVHLVGTIVYAVESLRVRVTPGRLVSVIEGGTTKRATRHERVLLEGSKSYDPDNRLDSNITYKWECFPLNKIDTSCWAANTTTPLLNSSHLSFNTSILALDASFYIFNLTVSKPGRSSSAPATFVLTIVDPATLIRIHIECLRCHDGVINAHERLVLRAVPDEFGESLRYSWDVSKIVALSRNAVKSRACPKEPRTAPVDPWRRSARRYRGAIDQDVVRQAPAAAPHAMHNEPLPPPTTPRITPTKKPRTVDHNGRALDQSGRLIRTKRMNRALNTPREPNINPGGFKEGKTGGGRSKKKPSNVETTKPPKEPKKKDEVTNKEESKTMIHVTKMDLTSAFLENTVALDHEALVLPPDSLVPGQHYMFTVTVRDEARRDGEAKLYLRVNHPPEKGDCTVRAVEPVIAAITPVTVFCRAWIDDDTNKGLSYRVGYSLPDGGDISEQQLLYYGHSSRVTIYLTAGTVGRNYTVVVHVSVLDQSGGEKAVCNHFIKVYPRLPPGHDSDAPPNHVDAPRNFREIWQREWSLLERYVGMEDVYNTRFFIGYLTDKLNEAHDSGQFADVKAHRAIRHKLLVYLHSVPVNDKFDGAQTLQILPRLSKSTDELSVDSLLLTTELLKSAVTVLNQKRGGITRTQLNSAVHISSDILRAVPDYNWATRDLGLSAVKTITKAVDSMLETLLTGMKDEEVFSPLDIHIYTDFLSVFYNQFTLNKPPDSIVLNSTKVQLPPDLKAVIDSRNGTVGRAHWSTSRRTDCYDVHLVNYHQNPFVFLDNKQVHSEVTSLSLFDCYGDEVAVNNLAKDNLVTVNIGNSLQELENTTYRRHHLNRSHMMRHSFNITQDNAAQVIHLEINLDRVEAHLKPFNISLLISCDDRPSPTHHQFRYDYSGHATTIPLIFEPYTFSAGQCHLGLVDSKYNAGRLRKGHLDARDYDLKLWSVECLYWNRERDQWSSDGCEALPESTIKYTHCRCDHMTVYGSHIQLINTDVHIVPVDSFFHTKVNPVTIAVVSVVFFLYIVCLVVCWCLDSRRARHSGPVYLSDSLAYDTQQFEITVVTGSQRHAGTTAKVSIILHGDDGISETRELYATDRHPLFHRNSAQVFITSFTEFIGRVWKIQVWHNNAGASPGWYLSRVIVKDLASDEQYFFVCEKWLAVEKDDGKVEREFMVVDAQLGFTTVFWAKVCEFSSYLLSWGSLLLCPTHNHYSHAQRLTVCGVALTVYMCLNALWYHYQVVEYRGEFVLKDVSWNVFVVGTISSLMTLPLILVLSSLFRSSNDHHSGVTKDKKLRTYKPTAENSSDANPHSDHIQPIMMHSILDQSLLNWQSIQEWAQKQWIKRQQAYVTNAPQIEAVKFTPLTMHKPETDCSSGFEDSASTERHNSTNPSMAACKRCQAKQSSAKTMHYHYCCMLPFWCRYITWCLCFLIASAASSTTIWLGYRFGAAKTTMWLQSLFFSFISSVFLVEPLMIQLCTTLVALWYRNDLSILSSHDDCHCHDDVTISAFPTQLNTNQCCQECEELERGVAARQRSRYLRFARPPQEKQLIQARQTTMKQKKALTIVSDWLSFIIVIVILTVIAFGKTDNSAYYLQKDLRNTFFLKGAPISLNSVTGPTEWFTWSRNTLLDGLFDRLAYDRFAQTPNQDPNNHIVGRVQLRQLRVTPKACDPAIVTHFPHRVCRPAYSAGDAAHRPYGYKNQTWVERNSPQQHNIYGYHGDYDNSGYSVILSNNRKKAYDQLVNLETNDWIDLDTRVIIVEYTLYSAPSNLFTSVALLAEVPPVGRFFPSMAVSSTYLYRYLTIWDHFILVFELLYLMVTLYKVDMVCVGMMKRRLQYLTDAWNVLEVLLCMMSVSYFGCYVYRFTVVNDTKEHLLSTYPNQFVDVSRLAHWDQVITAHIGVLVFIVICQSLYLLRYRNTFATLGSVYKKSYREIALFLAMSVIFVLAYATLGTAVFGAYSYNYRAVWASVDTVVGLLVRQLHVTDLYEDSGARAYIVTYIIFVSIFLTAYMIAVLSHNYKTHRQHRTLSMGYLEVMRFLWHRFLTSTRIVKQDVQQAEDTTLPAEFTMSEIENQVDELLFRMNAISGTHGLPEKPMCYFSDSDSTFALADDGISSAGSQENQTFDSDKIEERIQKIEENLYSKNQQLSDLVRNEAISDDVEKQLRNKLELEIFRQLQLQRHHPQGSQSSTSSSIETPRRILESGALSSSEPETPETNRFASKLPPRLDFQYGTTPVVTGADLLAQLSSESDTIYEAGGEPFPEHLIKQALSEFQPSQQEAKRDAENVHRNTRSPPKATVVDDIPVFGEEAPLPYDSHSDSYNAAPFVVFHHADGSVESFLPGSMDSGDLPPIETPDSTIDESVVPASVITHHALIEQLSSSTQESSSGSENDAYLRHWTNSNGQALREPILATKQALSLISDLPDAETLPHSVSPGSDAAYPSAGSPVASDSSHDTISEASGYPACTSADAASLPSPRDDSPHATSHKSLPGSTSSSDHGAIRCQKPAAKKGNLRKTKSRGKGKGGARSPPLEDLDDYALYSTDSGAPHEAWK